MIADSSFSQTQLTWFKVLHLLDFLTTWEAQANKQAGGVATTSEANKERMATAEMVNERIIKVFF